MGDFNPSKYKPGEGDDEYARLIKAGRYVLSIVRYVKKGTTKNGAPYQKVACEVCWGPHQGESFLFDVYIHEAGWRRLGALCHSMGYSESFNPRNRNEFCDALMFRPFGADVVIKNEKYADIRYFKDLTETEITRAAEWREQRLEEEKKRKAERRGQFSDEGDDWSSQEPPASDQWGEDFGDDDIPF